MKTNNKIHACLLVLFLFLVVPVRAQLITTIAGNGNDGYSGDGGPASNATLAFNETIAVDSAGNVYISQRDYHVIRMINTAGIINTIAGTGAKGYAGDGGPATAAKFIGPFSIAVDRVGNLYVADSNRIRKIGLTGTITSFAGNDTAGYWGDGGPATAASLAAGDIAVDDSGNILLESNGSRIRKIDATGIITTIAGTGTLAYSGDGGAATVADVQPTPGLVRDKNGNIYFIDYHCTIRRITKEGIISTIAGIYPFYGFGADGLSATDANLHYPLSLACDTSGDLFIADEANERIRKIDSSGIIWTAVGDPYYNARASAYFGDFGGDGGPATAAKLNAPNSVAFDHKGYLYINDWANVRIRKVGGANPYAVAGVAASQSLSIFPNPNEGNFVLKLPSGCSAGNISITNLLGQVVEQRKLDALSALEQKFELSGAGPGTYFVTANTGQGVYREKVVVW